MIKTRKASLGVAILAGMIGGLQAQPTDNPVLTAFPADTAFEIRGIPYGEYSWTDEILWSTVTTTTANGADAPPGVPNATEAQIAGSAADDLATVQAEIDSIALSGGGVLYFPAGTYYFSDDIVLKTGVVIRGATPGVSDARSNSYDPPTNFVFPRLQGIVANNDVPDALQSLDTSAAANLRDIDDRLDAVKKIAADDGDTIRNAGVVNIDLNRGSIQLVNEDDYLGGRIPATMQFGTVSKNRLTSGNIVAFGNRINNTANIYMEGPNGTRVFNGNGSRLCEVDAATDRFIVSGGTINISNIQVGDLLSVTAGDFFLSPVAAYDPSNSGLFTVAAIDPSGNFLEVAEDLTVNEVATAGVRLHLINKMDFDHNAWQVWPNTSKPHIEVMVKENVIAANNRINDNHWQVLVNGGSRATYPIDDFGMLAASATAPDSEVYLDRSGNRVNQGGLVGLTTPTNKYFIFRFSQGLGIALNRSSGTGYGNTGPSNPAGEPSLYRKGVVARQNWIYVSNRVGIQVSGNGLEVRDNVRKDRGGERVSLRPNGGRFQTNNSATYENRGIDLSGINILCDNNDVEVFSRTIINNDTGELNTTVDGESILVQQNDAGLMYNNRITNNICSGQSQFGKLGIDIYRVPYNRNIVIAGNTVVDRPISVVANLTNSFVGIAQGITIVDNVADEIVFQSPLIAQGPNDGVVIANNTITSGPQDNVIRISDYTNAAAPNLNDVVYTLCGNSVTETLGRWASGNDEEFPLENVIDGYPVVTIVSPAPGDVLTAGVPVAVEVEVDLQGGANSLESVTLYDARGLAPGQAIFNDGHRTEANSLAGALVLTGDLLNGGTFTGNWTPNQDQIDFGIVVVEAVKSEITIKDGETKDPAVDAGFKDRTMELIGFDSNGLVSARPSAVDVVIASGTDPELTFDTVPGAVYKLQKRTSLTTGDWADVDCQYATGDGTSKTLSDPGSLPGDSEAFYRVLVI